MGPPLQNGAELGCEGTLQIGHDMVHPLNMGSEEFRESRVIYRRLVLLERAEIANY